MESSYLSANYTKLRSARRSLLGASRNLYKVQVPKVATLSLGLVHLPRLAPPELRREFLKNSRYWLRLAESAGILRYSQNAGALEQNPTEFPDYTGIPSSIASPGARNSVRMTEFRNSATCQTRLEHHGSGTFWLKTDTFRLILRIHVEKVSHFLDRL